MEQLLWAKAWTRSQVCEDPEYVGGELASQAAPRSQSHLTPSLSAPAAALRP